MWRTLRGILQNCMTCSATPPMSIRGCNVYIYSEYSVIHWRTLRCILQNCMICSATPPMLCVYEGVMSIYSEYPVIHVTNFTQHSPKLLDLFRHTLLWVYEGVMSIYSEYPVIHLPNFTLHSPKLCDMFRHTSYEYTRVLRCIFWIFCSPCDELYAAFSKTVWYVPPHPLRVCILCVGVNLCRQRLFWTGRATQICCLRSSLKGQCQEIVDPILVFKKTLHMNRQIR